MTDVVSYTLHANKIYSGSGILLPEATRLSSLFLTLPDIYLTLPGFFLWKIHTWRRELIVVLPIHVVEWGS
jgi:hypothetical protein